MPIPFRMLSNVLFVYKKGHIHASVTIKSPADGLWKRNSADPLSEKQEPCTAYAAKSDAGKKDCGSEKIVDCARPWPEFPQLWEEA